MSSLRADNVAESRATGSCIGERVYHDVDLSVGQPEGFGVTTGPSGLLSRWLEGVVPSAIAMLDYELFPDVAADAVGHLVKLAREQGRAFRVCAHVSGRPFASGRTNQSDTFALVVERFLPRPGHASQPLVTSSAAA